MHVYHRMSLVYETDSAVVNYFVNRWRNTGEAARIWRGGWRCRLYQCQLHHGTTSPYTYIFYSQEVNNV